MRRVALFILCLFALAVAACGSRADTEASPGNAEVEGEGSSDGGEGEGGSDAAVGPDSTELGTIENPCSDDEAEGEPAADVPGVTEDTIRIGVISDKENPAVPLPTVGIEESMLAFVEFCNEAGGINGRQLELQTYDSMISRTEEATQAACRDDLFALVGTGSVQDQQGIGTREECGLVEVGAYSATTSRTESENFFGPVPGLSATEFNSGPCQWIAEEHPEAVTSAAMVYTDLPAASVRGQQIVDGCEAEAGFDFVVEQAMAFGDTDFSSLVQEMKDEEVKYFTMVSATSETLALLEEIRTQGIELEVIDLGQQYYDNAIAESAAADGAYVLTNTAPFSEGDDNPVLGLYQQYMESVGAADRATTLGVQAFSAGLLWATAVDALGNDITREGLVTELEGITEWDGGGLHMPANPGEGIPISCFLYLEVEGGEFTREHPEEDYDCDDAYLYTSDEQFES
jgi:ABC-type branched-subunit amino acid transport system substrate-binding protein